MGRTVKRFSSVIFWVVTLSATILACALVDVNRYYGMCGRFNDSTNSVTENHKHGFPCNGTAKAPGAEPGHLWPRSSRSGAAWIFYCCQYAITSIACLFVMVFHIMKRNKAIRRQLIRQPVAFTKSDEHTGELHRVCGVIFLCACLSFLYESIEVAKTWLCGRTPDETAYHILSGISFVVQGAQVLFEVSYQRERNAIPRWQKSIFIYLGFYNVMLWGDSIANTICKIDRDNELVLDAHVEWHSLRPIVKSSVTFFRILSASLYFTLALNESTDDELKTMSNGETKKTLSQVMDSLVNEMTVSGGDLQELRLDCKRRSRGRVTTFALSSVTMKQRQVFDISFAFSFFAIPFIVLPSFIVTCLNRLSKFSFLKKENWVVQWKHYGTISFDATLSSISLLVIAACLVLIPSWKSALERIWKCIRRPKEIHPEAATVIIFGLASLAFDVIALTFNAQYDKKKNTDAVTSVKYFSHILQMTEKFLRLVFILVVKFKHNVKETSVKKRLTPIGLLLGVESVICLSFVFLSIQKEHSERKLFKYGPAKGLLPFVVDFQVHSTLLIFSILLQFIQKQSVSVESFIARRSRSRLSNHPLIEEHESNSLIEDSKQLLVFKAVDKEEQTYLLDDDSDSGY